MRVLLAALLAVAVVSASSPAPQCLNGGKYENGACKCRKNYSGKHCEIGIRCCLIYGDPHYLTFDGAKINFQGSCRYTVAQICPCVIIGPLAKSLPEFDVSVENWRKDRLASRVSWTRTVTVKVSGHVVTLGQDGLVMVDGAEVSLPYNSVANVSINVNGDGVKLSTGFGASVAFDGRAIAIICVPESWNGRTCGICGNNNGKKRDDFVTRDGNDVFGLKDRRGILIGNSWRDPDFKKDSCKDEVFEHKSQPSAKWVSMAKNQEHCGVIVDRAGPFASCIERLGTDKIMGFYDSCLFDVYESQPETDLAHKMACTAIKSLEQECKEMHAAPLNTWYGYTKCQAPCHAPTHFSLNATACPATCSDPDAPSKCTEPPTEGCVCDDGYILSGTQCVKGYKCGCTDKQGTYHKISDDWFDAACTKRFRCKLVKGHVTPQIVETSPCRPHEYCKPVNGKITCVKKPVPGGWSKWGQWSDCQKFGAEEGLVRVRVHTCNKPEPKYGGKCEGESYETTPCI